MMGKNVGKRFQLNLATFKETNALKYFLEHVYFPAASQRTLENPLDRLEFRLSFMSNQITTQPNESNAIVMKMILCVYWFCR